MIRKRKVNAMLTPLVMLQPKVKVFYHADKLHYLPPEEIDLAHPSCQVKIVSHESFEKWGIDPAKWLPS